MLEKGQLIPDVALTLLDGTQKRLWDFRQKCHVLLLVGDVADVRASLARLSERQKTFAWLGVDVVALSGIPEGFSAGAFAVDRYGELVERYSLDDTLADRVERDFIYHEACRC